MSGSNGYGQRHVGIVSRGTKMSRPNKRGLELSFHKGTKRWYKTINGKPKYFGDGAGVSDRESYKAALAAYRAHMDTLEQESVVDQVAVERGFPLNDQGRAMIQWAMQLGYIDADGKAAEPMRGQKAYAEIDRLGKAAFRGEPVVEPNRQRPRISKLRDDYMKTIDRRRKLTETQPETLTPKERISKAHHYNVKGGVELFVSFAETEARRFTFGDGRQTEKLLADYRESLVDKMIGGEYTSNTVNGKLRALRPFVRWCYENRNLDELPRNERQVFKQFSYEPNPKPLDLKIVKKLWKNADQRMKLFIALGCNCAMYAAEIGTLTPDDLFKSQDGTWYIASNRGKTGAPYKIKLWGITHQLIEAERDDPNDTDLLFLTRRGKSVGSWNAVRQAFTKLRDQLGIDATFSQLRDTTATQVERIAERVGNPELTSMILAHKDSRTARFYANKSPKLIDSSALDVAVDELESWYGLTLDETEQRKAS